MAERGILRRIFEPIAQDWWMYPALMAAATLLPAALGLYEEWEWMFNTFQVVCGLALFCGLPMNLTMRHFGDRAVGPKGDLSLRGLSFYAITIVVWLWLGGEATAWALERMGSEFPFEEVGPGGLIFGLLLCGSFITVQNVLEHMRNRLHELEIRELRARQESTNAQLQAIQARIQPHFLFNCLNTVASLIRESPEVAEEAVERLSDLFRYTLQASKRRSVSLEEEIGAVRSFLALERLRYGDRVKAALHLAPGLDEIPVPPLVLQPIVENAILHGIAPRREGGRLEVRVEPAGPGEITLEVEDDGPGPGASSHRGTRTALVDLRRRLAILYGDGARVEEGRGALGGYRIRIALPLEGPLPAVEESP